MAKADLKRELPSYAARRGRFDVVDVPPLRYLMVDGRSDPNTAEAYQEALSSLYPLAYRLKLLSRRELDRDYVVPPLEGLWWADDPSAFTSRRDKSLWEWTLMLLVPDWLDEEHLRRVRGGVDAPLVEAVRLEQLAEGRCVQTLHVGSYEAEAPLLQRLHHEVIPAHGLRPTGKHHEIYLSDARRTAPERLRTILRQPVETLG